MIATIHLLQRRLAGHSNRAFLPWLLASAALLAAGLATLMGH